MSTQNAPARVVITDIDIKFGSLLILIIKVTFASLLATLLLSLIIFLFLLILSFFFTIPYYL
jgi:hypothetical protein